MTAQSHTTMHSSIEHFMTANPHCIGREQSLAAAHERMKGQGVRHLPVLAGGKLVGIVSQRDLLFVETLRDAKPAEVAIAEAMSGDVYTVPPERPIGEVAARMLERKFGCAVVVRDGAVVGIFTTTDALRTLMNIVDAWR